MAQNVASICLCWCCFGTIQQVCGGKFGDKNRWLYNFTQGKSIAHVNGKHLWIHLRGARHYGLAFGDFSFLLHAIRFVREEVPGGMLLCDFCCFGNFHLYCLIFGAGYKGVIKWRSPLLLSKETYLHGAPHNPQGHLWHRATMV